MVVAASAGLNMVRSSFYVAALAHHIVAHHHIVLLVVVHHHRSLHCSLLAPFILFFLLFDRIVLSLVDYCEV